MSDTELLSQHPVDRLVREVIRSRRSATLDEVDQIIARMSQVPFNQRIVSVDKTLQGAIYMGHPVEQRAPSQFVHLLRRVLLDGQWAFGTTEQEYLQDLRQAIISPSTRLAIYKRQGGDVVAVLGPNVVPRERLGPSSLPYLYVVYSADRGIIVTGYQVAGLDEVHIPGEVQWLK